MVEVNKSLDGTLAKAISASEKLKGLPKFLQSYMLAGDFKIGRSKKIDMSNTMPGFHDVESYAAQLAGLDKTRQEAVFKMTDFGDNEKIKNKVQAYLQLAASGEKVSGALVDAELKTHGFNDALREQILTETGLMDTEGNYLMVSAKVANANGEDIKTVLAKRLAYKDCEIAVQGTELTEKKLAQTILTAVFSQQAQTATTWAQKIALDALTFTISIAKQAAISFGIALVTWAASKAIDYVKNLKTHSEELVETMNDSHDAAEQATKDVEEIQSKIDELNDSIKAAGVKKIEDIVDPAERERLQAINDTLQAQLELKKQLEKDAADKANADTSAVVNDKTEFSINKKKTTYLDANGEVTTDPKYAVTTIDGFEKVSKTESLHEYAAALEDTTQKRRDLQVELDQIEASSGKDSKEYANKKKELDALNETFESQKTKVEELSTAVSEQMGNYKTDADSFAQYKNEYVAGTNAMTEATKALANANDDVGVSTTNYDILLQKMQATKNLMDRRNKDTSNNNPYTGAVKTLKASGLETGDDIRELSAVPANQTKAQAEAIKVLENAAKDAGVTLDQFVSALEAVGLVAVRNSNKVKSLSDAMTALDNMQSAYQSCAQAVKEYNKTGYVTMDTLQSLCQLEPQYLNMLDLKNGKLKINTKTAQSLTQANIQLAKASLLADTLNNIKDTNNLAKAEALLGDVTAVISDADTAIDAATEKSAQQAKDSDGWAGYDKVKRAGDIYRKNYHTLSGLLDNLGKQDPSKIWGKNDTSKSTKQATSAIDAWSTLSSAMEEYNKQGSISLNTMKSLMGLEEKYTACLKKQGNELTIDATKFRDMIQTELKAAAATADTSDKTKAKVAQYNQILKYLDENAKDGTISLNELRDAIEGVGTSLDKAQEKTSGLKSAFGTIHDILNTDNPAGALTSDSVASVVDLIQEHKELKNILFDESGNLQINEESLKNATIALLKNEKAATKDAAIQAVLQKSINDLSSGVISITDFLKGLNTELDDIDAKLDKFQSGFSDITDIVDEYNLYGKLTQDSMQKLLRLDPQYLECLEKEGDQLKFNAAQYRLLYAEQLHQFAMTAKTQTQRDVYTSMLADIFGFTPDQVEEYKSALSEYDKTVKEVQDAGLAKYGNVDNINRTRIDWTAENMEKYHDFVAEQNELEPDSIVEGSYSTVLGASNAFETDDGEKEIAYTPMLQTEDGVVPLTSNEIASYINDVIAKASKLKGGATAENILKIDAEGLFEGVAGEEVEVKNMIAGIEGQIVNGVELTAADIAAIGGETAENLQKYFGESSEWAGKSMHDVQSKIFDSKENVEKLTDVLNSMGIDGAKVMQLLEEHFKDANTSAEKLKAALNDIKDVFSSLLSLFEKFNTDKGNDLKIWGDAMGKVIDKRIEALNKQKEALEENNEATERAIELSKAQDALARAQQQRTTRVYTENGYEWQANAEDVRTAREDLADKQREWNNKDAEKAIDDQIKKYNEFKDKLSEVMDDIGKSWKDYQKELEYTAQIQKMSLSQMEGSLDGYHNKIIASLNTGSAITGIQNLITNLESLINTLTKLNNLYSMFKTGEYKDLGTKGLWNTIKGFLNNGGEKAASSGTSYVNAAKQAVNAVKTTLVDTATETGTALKNILTTANNNITKQVVSSGNGIINAFTNIWNTIKGGAQSLFGGSGEGGGIVSTVVNGFKAVGNAVSKSKIGSTILGGIGKVGTTLLSGGGKLLAGAGKLIGTAGSALAAAGPAAIPILAAGGLGIYGGTKAMKNQKKIWSNKEDGFGKKAIKSVASFFWDISPIGGIVNLCKDIFGKSKETAENTKDTANSSSETAENTQKSATNLTINATQIVSKEENKATDETDKKNDATANEDKTVKTAATTLTGAGLGAAAGMAVGGPVGALIGTLLGGFAGFFLGGHANGLKSSKTNHFANVDERGSELIVRKPASGRYTYLETGDGVVPADITSRLFEMGGNPDKWFSDQLAKHSSASMVQSRDAGGISLSIGDVNVNNPVGDSDALARELVNRLPNKVVQELNRR